MPEIRYIETYKDGVMVSKIPFVVSDEELAAERRAQKLGNIAEELEKLEAKLAEIEQLKLKIAELERRIK